MSDQLIPDYKILSNPDWLSWNSQRTGLRTHTQSYHTSGATLSTSLYLTAQGRPVMPTLTPYLAVNYSTQEEAQGSRARSSATSKWLQVAGEFAADLARRNPKGLLNLPPSITDVRPFQWAGFIAEPRYTYTAALPYDSATGTKALRKQIRRATARGFHASVGAKPADVADCLASTAHRKGFRTGLSASNIASLIRELGPERARLMSVQSPEGDVVSAGIRILEPGSVGIGLVQGTFQTYLSDGVAQLIQSAALNDLSETGAVFYDYAGANIPSVANAKSSWNLRLVTYYALRLEPAKSKWQRNAKIAVRRAIVRLKPAPRDVATARES